MITSPRPVEEAERILLNAGALLAVSGGPEAFRVPILDYLTPALSLKEREAFVTSEV